MVTKTEHLVYHSAVHEPLATYSDGIIPDSRTAASILKLRITEVMSGIEPLPVRAREYNRLATIKSKRVPVEEATVLVKQTEPMRKLPGNITVLGGQEKKAALL
jgi:hypothetical protein